MNDPGTLSTGERIASLRHYFRIRTRRLRVGSRPYFDTSTNAASHAAGADAAEWQDTDWPDTQTDPQWHDSDRGPDTLGL